MEKIDHLNYTVDGKKHEAYLFSSDVLFEQARSFRRMTGHATVVVNGVVIGKVESWQPNELSNCNVKAI
jgi:hypothetical protein